MAISVQIPPLGESVTQAVLVKWHKKSGQQVQKDEPVCELETDKANVDVPSPASGVISTNVSEGDTVSIGQAIAAVDEQGVAAASEQKPEQTPAPQSKASEPPPPPAPAKAEAPTATKTSSLQPDRQPIASPAAQRIAAESGIDPATVPGTGRGGRITKPDMAAAAVSGSTGREYKIEVGGFLAAVQRQRVTEVLADNAAQLAASRQRCAWLADRRRGGATLSMAQVSGLAHVKAAVADAGVRFLSVKGPALAAQTTGDFTARGSGDLDILVAPSAVAAAREALMSHGWRPRDGQPDNPGSWGWRHMLAAYYEMGLEGPRGTVDLHWRLDHTHDALPDFDALWRRRTPVTVGGQAVDTLSSQDAFCTAATTRPKTNGAGCAASSTSIDSLDRMSSGTISGLTAR